MPRERSLRCVCKPLRVVPRAAMIYDLVTDRYLPAPPLPYRAALVGLILDGEYVYCIAGEDRGQHRSDAVYRIKRTELMVKAADGQK